jgi:hypothetical protein
MTRVSSTDSYLLIGIAGVETFGSYLTENYRDLFLMLFKETVVVGFLLSLAGLRWRYWVQSKRIT